LGKNREKYVHRGDAEARRKGKARKIGFATTALFTCFILKMQLAMTTTEMNKLASTIIGGAIEVHKQMGPGLLESIYHQCMIRELRTRNLKVESQVPLALQYKGEPLNKDFYIDIIIEDCIIIELKAVETILPVHEAQLLTYLRLRKIKLGLIINFNNVLVTNGIKRLVNNF
jgi:GxxExxY protein